MAIYIKRCDRCKREFIQQVDPKNFKIVHICKKCSEEYKIKILG